MDQKIMNSIEKNLQQVGVNPGDVLLIHTSFKALGLSDVSPDDFIKALLSYLGPQGTLAMPSHTYSFTGMYGVEPFDPASTPGVGMGIVSETFRKYPGVLRSDHPTHAVVAKGQYAQRIVENKGESTPAGAGSSYEILHQLGAKILLIGVKNDRNTMVHYAEAAAKIPYNDIPYRAFWGKTVVLKKGDEVIEYQVPEDYPACSDQFIVLDQDLDEAGLLQRTRIADANSMLVESQKMVPFVVGKLKKQPDYLLCKNITCEPCGLRRRRLQELGLLK